MLAPLPGHQACGGIMAQGGATLIRVETAASRDVWGNHPLERWLVSHAMKASKFIGSVNVKVSSDEC
jgi:hypothetical protein